MAPKAEPESKRPVDSKFKQQKLPAWKPILTPRTVLPVFFGVGISFLAVGIALLVASESVHEKTVEYTDCTNSLGAACSSQAINATGPTCICTINVSLSGYSSSTYIYYALDNYYQNHRRYVKSRWDPQLRGKSYVGGSDCDPLTNLGDKPIIPCGLVANSLFNDTIELFKCNGAVCTQRIPLSGYHISWASDRDTKFKNPDAPNGDLCQSPYFQAGVQPPNWRVPICQLGQAQAANSSEFPFQPYFGSSGLGMINEDFLVWMRTAALPNFRKLYRKVDSLDDGDYQLRIGYNYPVTAFSGKKSVVISTISWIGGRNPFLGICYIVVACLCLLIGVVFLLLSKFKPRSLGDERYLSWDRK